MEEEGLHIYVEKGEGIIVRDSLITRSSDPYVKIEANEKGGQKLSDVTRKTRMYSSRCLKRNLNPEWNSLSSFDFDNLCEVSLLFRVWNKNILGSDTFLGEVFCSKNIQ